MKNLFGEEIGDKLPKPPRKETARGYASPPGSGPLGETCGTCKFIVRRHWGKVYLKCSLMREAWTRGSGTDIRARSPACR